MCWAPGGLLGDRILPVLCWSVVTAAPMVLLPALSLWLPCVALHPVSCHGEVRGPWGVLGLALLCTGPLGRELLGQGREPACSRLSSACAGDVLTPRERLTGSFFHLGVWLILKWSL